MCFGAAYYMSFCVGVIYSHSLWCVAAFWCVLVIQFLSSFAEGIDIIDVARWQFGLPPHPILPPLRKAQTLSIVFAVSDQLRSAKIV